MRSNRIKMITGLVLICMILAACGQKQTENPYGEVIAGLEDHELYAFLKMDYNYMVCVTTDMVYDEGSERQAAVYCDVYYYVDHEVKKLGTVMSDGTAYPVSFSKDGIFVESGHAVEKYTISEKDGTLELEKDVDEQKLLAEYRESQIIHFAYGASDECINEIMGLKIM